MKLIDLDKFKETTPVRLEGKEYEVTGFTVGDFIKEDLEKELNGKDAKGQAMVIVNKLQLFSNIPEEVLLRQQFGVLNALIAICQGSDPTEDSGKEKPSSKK